MLILRIKTQKPNHLFSRNTWAAIIALAARKKNLIKMAR